MSAVPIDDLLTPAEVAAMLPVKAKTVTRWARAGRITAVRTLGGHRRFRRRQIAAFLSLGSAMER
jgi:excisionase family DNA binding protein